MAQIRTIVNYVIGVGTSSFTDIAKNLNFEGSTGARMGLETFANNAEVQFNLNTYTSSERVTDAISFQYSGV